ncbi:MarR family transcriptional regulator [Marispirochaeta aestuarii]|uniref:MarR family transcriptional regulator n=1 Tax=Marispirochaeta aestuarii TaxID=1963862 RepID=UPI0029C92EB7|nr:MarR family transcriptional regulator [Marispirochaeta aestuarii]
MATIAVGNEALKQPERLIDLVIDFKNRCNIEEKIGSRYGLSPREVMAIFLLNNVSMSSKELSMKLGVSTSRGSRIIGGLLDRGLLVSEQDADDRRSSILGLSSAGKEHLKDLSRIKDTCERDFLEKLDTRQIEQVRQGMKLLLQVV